MVPTTHQRGGERLVYYTPEQVNEFLEQLERQGRTIDTAFEELVDECEALLGSDGRVDLLLTEVTARTLGRVSMGPLNDSDPEYYATRTLILTKVLANLIDRLYYPEEDV